MTRILSVLLPLATLSLLPACADDDPVDDDTGADTDSDTDTDTDTDSDTEEEVSATLALGARAVGTVAVPLVVGTVTVEGADVADLDVLTDDTSLAASIDTDGTLLLTGDTATPDALVTLTLTHGGETLDEGSLAVQLGPDRSVWSDWLLGGRVVEAVDTAPSGDIHWFVHSEKGVLVQTRTPDAAEIDDRSIPGGIAQPGHLKVLEDGSTLVAARVSGTSGVDTAAFLWPAGGTSMIRLAEVSTEGTEASEIRVRDLAVHADGELSLMYEAMADWDGQPETIGFGVDRFAWEGERLQRAFRSQCGTRCPIAGDGDALRIANLRSGQLQSLDVDGEAEWSTPAAGIEHLVTGPDGVAYGCGGTVAAWDVDGTSLWEAELSDGDRCTDIEVGFDGSVYAVTAGGTRVRRFDATGTEVWSTPIGRPTEADIERITGFPPKDLRGRPTTLLDVQIRDLAPHGGDVIAVGTLRDRYDSWQGPRDGKLLGVVVRLDAATGALQLLDDD